MEKQLKDIFPILAVEHDCMVSKQGDITLVFELSLPEIFTLSDEDCELLHQSWVKAIKLLPKHTVLHKQDWFIKKEFKQEELTNSNFLNTACQEYFNGRNLLAHHSYVMLTKKPTHRKLSSSVFSNLIRPQLVSKEVLTKKHFQDFIDVSQQFKQVLEDSKLLQLKKLKRADLISDSRKIGLIEKYCYLVNDESTFQYKDINFKEGLAIGDHVAQIYALGDATDLPPVCGSRMTYEPFSTDKTKFPISFPAPIGLLMDCNHIYNQFIFIDDANLTLKKLEQKRLRLQSLSAYSRENSISRDATNDFLNEAISQQRLPVKAHFNVMVFADHQDELKQLKNKVTGALAQMDIAAKPENVGAPQIWWAGIPGNEADFPMNDTFDTFAEQASCFINMESNYKSQNPLNGIRFCDRLSNKPVYVDLFDEPRKRGITSNMGMLVCGTSGGGKSMTVNHILSTLFTQGAHCVTVDIGGSYKGLCELVNGYYFTYTEEEPIRFNPFYLPDGEKLDTEKKESLKSLLAALWKQENEHFQRSEYVALSNALQGYYEYLGYNTQVFPCFNSFYDYLKTDYAQVLKEQKVKDKEFDLSNFLYVLRPYYKGGEFDFLLNAHDNLDLLNQAFIVIELDNIKDHPILFPVVTLIIMELFISKMRKLKGTRKVLTIDEAWKAIAKSGMAEFLKYAFKTIRKFNGIPIVITQELDDLISSPIIKDAIINNADIKILMDMKKFINKFDRLQDVLGLSEKGKAILLSVNKDHREVYIDLGGQEMKVYRNELCPEEYFAYTTEGKERIQVANYAQEYGGIEAGIKALVKDLNK